MSGFEVRLYVAPANVFAMTSSDGMADGYAPNWNFTVFFVMHFAITALVFYHQALFWRKWRTFSIACAIGCVMQSGGYVGRLLLHNDPFSNFGFKLNVTLLTVAPAFTSLGLYLTLKVAVNTFGQHLSRLPAAWYARIFVSCDIVSIVFQGAGGAISAVAQKKPLLDLGVHVMIVGLISQLVTLTIFLCLVIEYFLRCRQRTRDLNPGSLALAKSSRFQVFVSAMGAAFLCIYIRCCYRTAELWGGWGNHIMRQEAEFIILESDMCALAVLLMSVFHPQIFFKEPDRIQMADPPASIERWRHDNIQPAFDLRPQPRVDFKSHTRVTMNPSLTEWEKEGVRGLR